MSLTIDGAAILRAIVEQPSLFGMGEAQVNALAMSAVAARLKDKLATLGDVRTLHRRLGDGDMRTALDQCATKDIAALVKRLDPKNPALRGSDERWQRDRVLALVEGADPVMPAPRPPRATAPRATTKVPRAASGSKTGTAMQSESLKANRELRDAPDAASPSPPPAPRRRSSGKTS